MVLGELGKELERFSVLVLIGTIEPYDYLR
jgi:hypothetical protein